MNFVFQNAFYCHVCHRNLCVIIIIIIIIIVIIILYSEYNPEKEDPEVIPIKGLLPNYIKYYLQVIKLS